MLQIDELLVRRPEEAAQFAAQPLQSPAARLVPAKQCEGLIAEMLAANTVKKGPEEPLGRGMRRR